MEVKDNIPSKEAYLKGTRRQLFVLQRGDGHLQKSARNRNKRKIKPLPIQLEKRYHGKDRPNGKKRTHATLFPFSP